MGLVFMCPISVQPNVKIFLTLQENIFDVHHLVDLPVTVVNMAVADVSYSASMTDIHACVILL